MTFADDKASLVATRDSLLAAATGYLQQLQDAANVSIVTGTTELPESYNYATVPNVIVPTFGAARPNLGSLSFPAAPSAPNVAFDSISAIALPIDDVLAPTSMFAFAEQPYLSILLNPLQTKLLNDLLNGGYGIDTTDEIMLTNRARDREVEVALTRINEAGRSFAIRGFPLPPGQLQVSIDRALQDMQDKVSSVSRDIYIERAKLFVENRQFTMKEVRELEAVTMNYWNLLNERTLNVAKMTAEFGITVFNAILDRYKTRLSAAEIAANVNRLIVDVDVARARVASEIFTAQIAGYDASLRGLLEPARLQVDLYRADVDEARVLNDAYIAGASLQERVLDASVQQNIEISRMTIENARARILGVTSSLQFQTEAAKFGSNAYFAQLTALFNSIATLSVSTQAS